MSGTELAIVELELDPARVATILRTAVDIIDGEIEVTVSTIFRAIDDNIRWDRVTVEQRRALLAVMFVIAIELERGIGDGVILPDQLVEITGALTWAAEEAERLAI